MPVNIRVIIIFGVLGLYSILAGALNWDFFFNNRRARIFVKIFGRNGARIFYVVFGIVVAALGFFIKV